MKNGKWTASLPVSEYIETLRGADTDKLLAEFREVGTRLAEAASCVLRSWDGHHRLALAIADWYETIGNERKTKARKK